MCFDVTQLLLPDARQLGTLQQFLVYEFYQLHAGRRGYKAFALLALLLSLMSGKGAYARTWVSLNGSKEGKNLTTEVLQSDLNGHKVRMTIQGFYDDRIVKEGTEYHQPFLDMYEWLTYEGEPQLPTLHQTIAIPEGAEFKVTIMEEKWTDVEIGKIYPAQRDVKECDPEPPFTIKESAYQQEVYTPFLVTTGEEWNWWGIRGNTVHVCPFRYHPLDNRLSVLTDFVLQIEFSECSGNPPVRVRDLKRAIDWHMFDNNISGFPVKSDMAKSSPDDYDYLIIVGDIPYIRDSQALKDFTQWKAFKGYKTKVVSTDSTGITPSDIKNYIYQEQINHGIKYVLFIGDHDKIPMKVVYGVVASSDTVKSDYWYGCLDNDNYYANIPIGRFSVDAVFTFNKMVEKTIAYERSYNGNYKKTLLVAHKEEAPYKYQECCETIRGEHTNSLSFTTAYGALAAYPYQGDNATNSQVVNHINSGMHIVNYRGHGIPDSWGYTDNEPDLNGWNASCQLFQSNQINNISTCSIYFNSCCKTGNIEEEPCMMEAFTRSSLGAVACLAATENTHTNANHAYDQQLFNLLLNNNVWNIGDLNIQAHKSIFETKGVKAKYNALSFLCGGDPTLEIWTGTPSTFSDISVTKSNENIIVSSPSFCSGDIVSVVNSLNGELIHRIEVSGYSCSFPIPLHNFHIAVNRHNYYPYVRFYRVSRHIQNVELDNNETYVSTPIHIGYDVEPLASYGNVVVKSGAKLTILNGTGGVTIKNGFECENGAELVIE